MVYTVPRSQVRQRELLEAFCDRLRQVGKSRFTVNNYRYHVLQLIKAFPGLPFEDLTTEHLERHLYNRQITNRSKVAELAGLSSFFQYLQKHQRLVSKNPCEEIEKPKFRRKIMPAPSFDEWAAGFSKCRNLEEQVIFNLFFQAALRLREGIRLQVKHIRLQDRQIFVEGGKGDKDRISVFDPEGLPAHLRLGPLLERWLAGRGPEDWVFPSRYKKGHRNTFWVQQLINRIGREIGLPYRLRPHLLRHGWVLWSAESELPIDAAQEQLGHSSISTTEGMYRKMSGPRLRRAIDKHMGTPGLTVVTNGYKPLDTTVVQVHNRGVTMATSTATETAAQTMTVQVGREFHEVLRELAYVERTTIRSLIEEAVRDLKAKRKNGS